jgi:hypothetical protein
MVRPEASSFGTRRQSGVPLALERIPDIGGVNQNVRPPADPKTLKERFRWRQTQSRSSQRSGTCRATRRLWKSV